MEIQLLVLHERLLSIVESKEIVNVTRIKLLTEKTCERLFT